MNTQTPGTTVVWRPGRGMNLTRLKQDLLHYCFNLHAYTASACLKTACLILSLSLDSPMSGGDFFDLLLLGVVAD